MEKFSALSLNDVPLPSPTPLRKKALHCNVNNDGPVLQATFPNSCFASPRTSGNFSLARRAEMMMMSSYRSNSSMSIDSETSCSPTHSGSFSRPRSPTDEGFVNNPRLFLRDKFRSKSPACLIKESFRCLEAELARSRDDLDDSRDAFNSLPSDIASEGQR